MVASKGGSVSGQTRLVRRLPSTLTRSLLYACALTATGSSLLIGRFGTRGRCVAFCWATCNIASWKRTLEGEVTRKGVWKRILTHRQTERIRGWALEDRASRG